jgi:putative transposase
MPRGPRLDAPGALHHVIARGIERSPIFSDDVDRTDFLDRLAALANARDLGVYAWALLTNHLHLLVRTGLVPLSRSMQRLLGGYASAFNARHDRVGYLFQSRFKSVVADEEPYLLVLLRYIHLNPLRAHLVADLDALDRHAWTGHAALLGHHPRPWQETDGVLQQFGTAVGPARRAYRAFVADGLAEPEPDLDGGGLRRSQGVWQIVGKLARGRERWAFDERVLGCSEFVAALTAQSEARHPPAVTPVDADSFVRDVVAQVAAQFGLQIAEITTNTRRRVVVRARALVSYAAVRNAGLPARRVAPLLGVSPRTVLDGIALAERRFPANALAHPELQPRRRRQS